MATDEELAYCAGVVDSDGCISVKRSTYSMRVLKEAKQPLYSERICVKQIEAVTLLKDLFGGNLRLEQPRGPNNRMMYCWNITDLRAANALAALRPYIRIKGKQADNCLRLREMKTESRAWRNNNWHIGRGRPLDISERMETCYKNALYLNRVGIRRKEDEN